MTDILKRKLGRSGIEVSAMGLGCWAIGGPFWRGTTPSGWGEVDDNESIAAIHRGLELGINFLDTANVYGAGHSEKVLAQALKGRRQEVVIATKFGNLFNEETRQITGSSATPDGIRAQCEESLRRLNTDYIDLYQLHIGDLDQTLAVDVVETLERLVAAGKIRSYGWSTDDPNRERIFAQGEHCTAVQNQMNVLDDAAGMIAVCEELNLASVNRGPLAMGLLTGKYQGDKTLGADDVRGTNAPAWMRYFKDGKPSPEWLQKMEAIREILTSGGRTLAQGAIAWLWGRSDKTIPIPGFRTVAQVEENCGAMHFGALNADQMQEIDTILGRN
jgi:aryl-alcohol dehydrogenase-like predicted oxidoreductase